MRINGIRVPHNKGTENCETVTFSCPETVRIPMSQHMGAPCAPLVKKGDKVKVGQKIGDSDAFLSCPVHSSVSGEVTAVSDILLSNGKYVKAVEIACDGEQSLSEEVKPPQVTDKASLVKAVRESGCCGLGGAGFPTHIKLNVNEEKQHIDYLVINAAECEPYITSDYREMIENPDGVINGVKLVRDMLGIENVRIGIETNKPKAISLFEKKLSGEKNMQVVRLKTSYPQGAEKVIAFYCTGRIIAEGKLPADHGIIVMNVSTAAFIDSYVRTGMPLVQRRLTIDGDAVKKPCNIKAPIGVSFSELLSFAETDLSGVKKLISGGLMMGTCVYDENTPLCKTNNALLAFTKSEEPKSDEKTNCIRCGRCVRACPVGLMPTELEKAYDRRSAEDLNKLKIKLCMNCGSCSFVCPAKRNLAEKNQLAKAFASRK